MSNWKVLSSEIAYETAWIKVHRDEVLNHNGKPLTYSFVESQHPSVLIIAVNSAGEILFEKNYRYTLDQVLWELPAGQTDGQDGLTAAKRELLEEASLVSSDWREIEETVYLAPGLAMFPCRVFIAHNVQPATEDSNEEIEEILERRFFSLAQIEELIQNKQLINAGDAGVIYLARVHGLLKEEK